MVELNCSANLAEQIVKTKHDIAGVQIEAAPDFRCITYFVFEFAIENILEKHTGHCMSGQKFSSKSEHANMAENGSQTARSTAYNHIWDGAEPAEEVLQHSQVIGAAVLMASALSCAPQGMRCHIIKQAHTLTASTHHIERCELALRFTLQQQPSIQVDVLCQCQTVTALVWCHSITRATDVAMGILCKMQHFTEPQVLYAHIRMLQTQCVAGKCLFQAVPAGQAHITTCAPITAKAEQQRWR